MYINLHAYIRMGVYEHIHVNIQARSTPSRFGELFIFNNDQSTALLSAGSVRHCATEGAWKNEK